VQYATVFGGGSDTFQKDILLKSNKISRQIILILLLSGVLIRSYSVSEVGGFLILPKKVDHKPGDDIYT
jgi:hypothetical protein